MPQLIGNLDRDEKVVNALANPMLDAVIGSSPSEVLLPTRECPGMSRGVVASTAEGRAAVIVPDCESELALHTSLAWIPPDKPAELYTLTNPPQHLKTQLDSLCNERNLSPARYGTRMLHEKLMTLKIHLHPAAYCGDCGGVRRCDVIAVIGNGRGVLTGF